MLIILMARVPIPGKTKTRLQSHLSGKECAMLHRVFIKDMINMIKGSNFSAALAYTPASGETIISELISNQLPSFPQEGCDLGEKMCHCVTWGFQQGYRKVGLIGTDMPDLQPEYLKMAQEALDRFDVVIGPSEDGGYYFIGMKRIIPEIFRGMEWGGGTVREKTITTLDKLGLAWTLLPEQRDVDEWQDLISLNQTLERGIDGSFFPENTYEMLKTLDIHSRETLNNENNQKGDVP